jgi:hypothetical protein
MKSSNFKPRISLYYSDGHGRDSYIYCNSGGLVRSGNQIIKNNKDNIYSPINSQKLYNLKKDTSAVRYRCNGSGRDTYVQ